MSAFSIFFVIVTTILAIYYIVQISIDYFSNPNDRSDSSEESFELEDLPSETSKSVEETDGGFRVARDSGDGQPEWDETHVSPSTDAGSQPESDDPGVKLDASGAPITPAMEKIEATGNDMEEIETGMSGELARQVFLSALTTGKPPVPISKTIEKADGASPEEITRNDGNDDTDDAQPADRI